MTGAKGDESMGYSDLDLKQEKAGFICFEWQQRTVAVKALTGNCRTGLQKKQLEQGGAETGSNVNGGRFAYSRHGSQSLSLLFMLSPQRFLVLAPAQVVLQMLPNPCLHVASSFDCWVFRMANTIIRQVSHHPRMENRKREDSNPKLGDDRRGWHLVSRIALPVNNLANIGRRRSEILNLCFL